MMLRVRAKVWLHVWSYDFYDMTLPTEKQRRHMIKMNMHLINIIMLYAATNVATNVTTVPMASRER